MTTSLRAIPYIGSQTTLRGARVLTWLLAIFLIWLPLQTPISIVAFQYGHLSATNTRLILLLKDAVVLGLLLALAIRQWRTFQWQWFDVLAVVYAMTIVVYSAIPLATNGSASLSGVLASARQLLVPAELYGLGRLAAAAGGDNRVIIRVFLVAAIASALFTVGQYVLGSPDFYATSLDLVSFERSVQGFASASNLWNISILGDYGTGQGQFARAVGPFTHPVGTAHYFVLPLALAVAMAMTAVRRRRITFGLVTILFAASIVITISRGGWGAAVLAALVCGLVFRRLRVAALGIALAIAFVAVVPPFSASIGSFINKTDTSTGGHSAAIDKGLQQIGDNPLGAGVGQADKFGAVDLDGVAQTLSQGEELGVGENTYLSVMINAGPIALIAFVLMFVGLLGNVLPLKRGTSATLPQVVVAAAIIGYAASAMTSSPLMRFTTSASFWLIAGLVVIPGGLNGPNGWRLWFRRLPASIRERMPARPAQP